MYRLAKLGFTQSYTYFTWRTEKQETADYLVEVTTPPVADFFRPNFWPNTPDILHATLQQGGAAMFEVRLTLAALSVGNWGIYGPAMELLESTPRDPGSEEYLDSEKYEIKTWNLDAPESLAPFIRRLNEIRRTEPALQRVQPPLVQEIDDEHLLAWCRHDPATGNTVLVVVNLEPAETRRARLVLDGAALGLADAAAVAAHDLLTGVDAVWPVDAITIECSPDHPVQVYRLVGATAVEGPEAV
jgi:starch synthase (maltosyl-transferring)